MLTQSKSARKRLALLLSGTLALCALARGSAACAQPIRTTDETQYLLFSLQADVFAADPGAVFGLIDAEVSELVARIGGTGDGKFRRLGFFLVLAPWLLDKLAPEKVPVVVRAAFQVARKRQVAVYFAIESHYFWDTRPDLWNFFDPSGPGYDPENKNNVEWTDWQGSPYPARFLDWGTPQQLPPHMCYACPKIRSEVARLVAELIGPPLQAGLDELAGSGDQDLFAGVTVTSEPSVDNYSVIDFVDPPLGRFMAERQAPKQRLGYNALTRSGYTQANPPSDVGAAFGEVNREFAAHWARQLVWAGLPASKLYTHVAGGAAVKGWPGLDFTNAPLSAAFTDSSRPGWTTYPVGPLANNLEPIYDELARQGSPHWGGTEASPGIAGSGVSPYEYLRWHFDHGAVLVVMNTGATSGDLSQALRNAVWGDEAVAAYRRFFSEVGEVPHRPLVHPPAGRGDARRINPRPAP
jgi:hypothetical protein